MKNVSGHLSVLFSICMTVPLTIKRNITYMTASYMIDKIGIQLTIKKENHYSDTFLKSRNNHNCNNDKPFSLPEDVKCLYKLSSRENSTQTKIGLSKTWHFTITWDFNGPLLGLREVLTIASLSKLIKSAFYLMVKALSVLEIFTFLS